MLDSPLAGWTTVQSHAWKDASLPSWHDQACSACARVVYSKSAHLTAVDVPQAYAPILSGRQHVAAVHEERAQEVGAILVAL